MAEGWHAHQMAGFDRDAARVEFSVPDDFEPVVAIAIGDLGNLDDMPERLVEKELRPRVRKPLTDLVFTESWGTPLL